MASTTDIREWAKTQGLEVGAKGPLSPDLRAAYADAHTAPNGADPGPSEYPGDGAGDAVTAVAAASAPPAPPSDPRQAERAPARPRVTNARGRGLAERLGLGRKVPAGKTRTAARKLPRVSLANLIEDAWGQMAFAASSIQPMQRLLQAQAPFAGIALEDALAGTVVDRALQPVARAEDKAKAVGGLIFPPVALMLVLATAPVPTYVDGTDPPQYLFPEPTTQHKGAIMTLRWSLMLWSEAGAARLEEYKARAEANSERGAQADRFMAWILGMEPPPAEDDGQGAEAAAVSAEDEAVARAQQMFGG